MSIYFRERLFMGVIFSKLSGGRVRQVLFLVGIETT